MAFDFDMIRRVYARLPERIAAARRIVGRPMTLAEKILYAHMAELPSTPPVRGKDYVEFYPDRVAMQDATAQMALLQFMSAGIPKVAVPTTVHCDHLIRAERGAKRGPPNRPHRKRRGVPIPGFRFEKVRHWVLETGRRELFTKSCSKTMPSPVA